ncbi:MAG: PIG-L family deacetylase [Chloroflexi bacterium]|nr:PIG-L family deacetylase [Chloroflexota bacterium]MBI3733199.1 PIG-L family deacetylase [Chloroflexota bacterium]
MTDARVLLAVLAHPDDESFGPGGTLAKAARAGADVHFLCGTGGEAGTVAPEHLRGFDSVADLRWTELTCAAQALGLAGIHHLGFRDSGMAGAADYRAPQALAAQPLEIVTGRIAQFIRLLKPQVVITHNPDGDYRHPDHLMIHRATRAAFEAAGDPARFPDPDGLPAYQPQKLYYPVFSRRLLRLGVRLMPLFGQDPRRSGRNHDVDLTGLMEADYPVHAVVDVRGEPAAMKLKAIACHQSQATPLPRGRLGQWLFRWFTRRETFMRAYPPVNGPLRESDLFDGIG